MQRQRPIIKTPFLLEVPSNLLDTMHREYLIYLNIQDDNEEDNGNCIDNRAKAPNNIRSH